MRSVALQKRLFRFCGSMSGAIRVSLGFEFQFHSSPLLFVESANSTTAFVEHKYGFALHKCGCGCGMLHKLFIALPVLRQG